MEVRKRTICLAIFFWYIPANIGLKHRPYILVGTSNQSVPEMVIVHVFINIYELFTISTK